MASSAVARHLMGTRFEIYVSGDGDPVRLRAAAEEALDEVERLDRQLSMYRADSDLSDLNRRGSDEWVRLEPRLFSLLQHASGLSRATSGAFDPCVTPLLAAWGFLGASGRWAADEDVRAALDLAGPDRLLLDESRMAARFDRPGVRVDLGAIGKGYALDQAAGFLREEGISSALIHGGTSTVAAVGSSPDGRPWTVAIADPAQPDQVVGEVRLEDGQTLSVSAVHGKAFTGPDGRLCGHVLDPRTGMPVSGSRLGAVTGPSATESDALSTALLVLGEEGLHLVQRHWPETSALFIMDGRKPQVEGSGFILRVSHE